MIIIKIMLKKGNRVTPTWLLFVDIAGRHLCTPAMSTNSSQVGVALFPSF